MTSAIKKLIAIFFLIAIALVPVVIVILEPSRGGIWVAGYVTGMITAPVVAIGAIRALAVWNEQTDLNVVVGFVIFGILVTLISVAAALWSFLS